MSTKDLDKNALNTKLVLEGPGVKTFNRPGVSITIKDDFFKYFVLLICPNKKYDWYVHFENYSENPYTQHEKELLFTELAKVVKPGETVTTDGGVTPGGISALRKMLHYGFEEIGTKTAGVHWASKMTLNKTKWNEWIRHADSDDYTWDGTGDGPTLNNTKPVVLVLRKL